MTDTITKVREHYRATGLTDRLLTADQVLLNLGRDFILNASR